MGKPIPIDVNPSPDIALDPAPVAAALGLATDAFLRLLETRRISQLCERGTGAEEGLYRASFYHGRTRVRMVLDRDGRQVGPLDIRAP